MQVYFPGTNELLYADGTPLFWLISVFQVFQVGFSTVALKVYICLVVNCTYYGTTLMEILKYKITFLGISKVNEDETIMDLNKEIISCIKMQLDIKGFVL